MELAQILSQTLTKSKSAALAAKQNHKEKIPDKSLRFFLVDPTGLEPATSSVQARRSTR
jgi:hypothetical protein